jgi:glutamine---fructose-6-phosphate transaminase (isomerizing)
MAKEIHEQPTVSPTRWPATSPTAARSPRGARSTSPAVDRLVMVACGTAHYACHVGEVLVRAGWPGCPVEIDVASEFRYREPPLGPAHAGLFVSQSGETADTLAALRYMPRQGRAIVAVVNVETSRSRARATGAADPRGPRDRRRLDQGLHLPARGARAPRADAARQRGEMTRPRPPPRSTRSPLPGLLLQGPRARARDRRDRPRPRRGATSSSSAAARCIPLALEGALKLKESATSTPRAMPRASSSTARSR